jgi:hypothetical protein
MSKSVVTPAEHQRRMRESEQSLERLLAERDRLDQQIEATAQWRDQVRAAAEKDRGVRRSTMTAMEKSQYIREHGIGAYNQLPWA